MICELQRIRSWQTSPGLYLHHYEPLLFSSNFLLKVFRESRTAPAAFLSKISSSAADLLFLHCSFTSPLHVFSSFAMTPGHHWKGNLCFFTVMETKDLCVRGETEGIGISKWSELAQFFQIIFWEWTFNVRQLSSE